MAIDNRKNFPARRRILWLVSVLALCVGVLWVTRSALATPRAEITIVVDRIDDVAAAQDCLDAIAADCSLRGAISKANGDTANNYTIRLGTVSQCRNCAVADTYFLTLTGSAEDANVTGDLDITTAMTIVGSDSIIDASAIGERVLDVRFVFSGQVNLQDVTLRGGQAVGSFPTGLGGGIANAANQLNLNNVTVQGSSADNSGGGIYNSGGLLLTSSTIVSNHAGFLGGGILNGANSHLTILQSLVTSNTATNDGGGIYNNHNSPVTINSSFIVYNESVSGGGISNAGQMIITGSLLYQNEAKGEAFSSGGGISNRGRMTVTEVTISENSATYNGGGVNNVPSFQPSTPSRIEMSRVVITDNTAGGSGGGIYAGGDRLEVYQSTLSGNMAAGGGGFYADNNFTNLVNSTISGNSADIGGGILDGFSKSAQLINVTVTANRAITGAGIAARGFYPEEYYIVASIIADNDGDDVVRISNNQVSFVSNGYNVIGDGNAMDGFNNTGDVVNTNALLNPLEFYSGANKTHPPRPNSPAIDRVPIHIGRPIDQRGVARPVGAMSDSGSHEGAVGAPLVVGLISADVSAPPTILTLILVLLLATTILHYVVGEYAIDRRGATCQRSG